MQHQQRFTGKWRFAALWISVVWPSLAMSVPEPAAYLQSGFGGSGGQSVLGEYYTPGHDDEVHVVAYATEVLPGEEGTFGERRLILWKYVDQASPGINASVGGNRPLLGTQGSVRLYLMRTVSGARETFGRINGSRCEVARVSSDFLAGSQNEMRPTPSERVELTCGVFEFVVEDRAGKF